ncbi:phosphotransferase [Blastococcus sp. CT_GayMR16]|uniref:phosphotransferase n=1 Tax=Blastococcus sp. CT_GayMR16 TaxID=2559607 RepID=UPI001074204B|nr:phosphotransferase [Blastococcus sp. CT_GayMR16]TFV86130.1 aminoglycoside phosphotransferase family protein [Blastococcus sp. CT_GayMR16]
MSTDGATTTGISTWQDPAWRDDALAWAVEQLRLRGKALSGEAEQPHVYPWSTVFRLPVDGGAVWLKSVGPGSAHEPPLATALGAWVPDRVLVPLAMHPGRRLMLLPDGGPTLRAAGGAASVDAWTALLRDYALLQLELVPRAEKMVGLGVPDARLERLPGLVRDLLADDEALLLGRPGGLSTAVRDRVAADLGRYEDLCGRLADSGIPPTLQHDDLHDANVFVGEGRHRFFDWGDAVVSHPFLSLLVTLRVAQDALGVPNGDAALLRLRDAYLDVWRDHGTLPELRHQCDLALAVGPLQRALTWRRILRGVHAAERTEWQDSVPGWTAEHLEPGTLIAPASVQAGH